MVCMCKSELAEEVLEILAIEGYLSLYADAEFRSEYFDRLVRSDTESFRCWYCLNFGACSCHGSSLSGIRQKKPRSATR